MLWTGQDYSISTYASEHYIFKYHPALPHLQLRILNSFYNTAVFVLLSTPLHAACFVLLDCEAGKKTTFLTGDYMHGCEKRQCLQHVLVSDWRQRLVSKLGLSLGLSVPRSRMAERRRHLR